MLYVSTDAMNTVASASALEGHYL